MKEPSILDYLRSIFSQEKPISLAHYLGEPSENTVVKGTETKEMRADPPIHWQVIAGGLLALIAQYFLEPVYRNLPVAIGLYGAAAVLLWFGFKKPNLQEFINSYTEEDQPFSIEIKLVYFVISLIFFVTAFLAFNDNTFTWLNLFLLVCSILFFILSVWERKERRPEKKTRNVGLILLFILAFAISAFYRFYHLNQVPAEMFSDHAEKLLDVMDVLNGHTPIYFTRNTGREAIQFYLTAAIIKLFNTGISFLSLKLGTAFAGLITIPFIYLLGKQLGNQWVGLLAMFMAGIAYWPNVISRVALRFTLYPLFTAPVLYFLFKGLQTRNRNDLILSGVFLGLGLQGYSPSRIIPVYVVIVFFIYWLHRQNLKESLKDFWVLLLLAFAALVLFLPLFRYFVEHPTMVSYRALSRLTSMEHAVESSKWMIFLNNFWKASMMFFYENGQIWVHSVINRPALDLVTAAFFFLGLVYIIKRYVKFHQWEDMALLVAIPVLMLPSTLSLAFPEENPSLNRSGGAIVPVFIIAALGAYQFGKGVFIKHGHKLLRMVTIAVVILSFVFTLYQNYDLVFNQYAEQFRVNAWNTSEIGEVIKEFVAQGNPYENAFVVPYAHWVDTRLVGINAGIPWKDYALWPDDFVQTLKFSGNKLFILKPDDTHSLEILKTYYPDGQQTIYYSQTTGKNFILYSVSDSE